MKQHNKKGWGGVGWGGGRGGEGWVGWGGVGENEPHVEHISKTHLSEKI